MSDSVHFTQTVSMLIKIIRLGGWYVHTYTFGFYCPNIEIICLEIHRHASWQHTHSFSGVAS